VTIFAHGRTRASLIFQGVQSNNACVSERHSRTRRKNRASTCRNHLQTKLLQNQQHRESLKNSLPTQYPTQETRGNDNG
jgi:hypothetical protein